MKLEKNSDFIVDVVPTKCAGCASLESCKQNGTICDRRFTKDIQISVVQTEYRN